VAKRIYLLIACLVLSCFALSCGSSNTTASGNGTSSAPAGFEFTTPATPPVIENFGSSPMTVSLTVSASSGATVTWSLQNGSGIGKPVGTLTANGTSATYAPPPAQPPLTSAQCGESGGTAADGQSLPITQQVTVTASDTSGDTAIMPIFIIETPPCIATTASITNGICSSSATTTPCPQFPPQGSGDCTIGSSTCTCPAPGSIMPGGSVQPFQVGTYGSLPIYEGGGLLQPFGQPPFTWAVASGSLPGGLSIQPGPTTTSIFLAGTPVTPGCTTFSLQITDAMGATATLPYFAAVVPAAIKVQAPNNWEGSGGVAYPPVALVASGGISPYTWIPNPFATICNTSAVAQWGLPPGLGLSFPQNPIGVITGNPDPADAAQGSCGTYPLGLEASDSQLPYPALGTPSGFNRVSVASQTAPTLCAIEGHASIGGVSLLANAYLQGTYAFMLRGFDANGPVAIAGSVQMDGQGNITGGEEDVTRSGGWQQLTINPSGSGSQSAYTVGSSANRGCMMLTDSTGTTSTFAFTAGSCSNNFTSSTGVIQPSAFACGITTNTQGAATGPAGYYTTGRVIEFDNSGNHLSGILRMQTTSSFGGGLSGPYAFGLSGWDSTSGHYAIAGSMQASAGSFSSAAADIDDAGTLATALTGGSGTYASVDSAYGRSAATLTVGAASFDMAMYVVSANEAIIVTTDQLSASHPILSGETITTAGSFSTLSLQNSHMFHIGGVSSTGPDVSIGVLNFTGLGTVTGTVFEDQAGTLGSTAVSGNYSVDPNTGRANFSASQTNQTLGSHSFVGYLIPPSAELTRAGCATPSSCVTGFLVGTDSSAQDGMLEFQTSTTAPPPPFYNAYVLGDFSFGAQEALSQSNTMSEGSTSATAISSTANNTGTVAVFRDTSYGDCWQGACRTLIADEQGSGSYTVNTNGTGTFGGQTVSVTNGRVIFYLDESPLNLYPSVIVAEQ
jgi:hypothetical protein